MMNRVFNTMISTQNNKLSGYFYASIIKNNLRLFLCLSLFFILWQNVQAQPHHKSSKQWQTIGNFNEGVIQIDRINSNSWETKKVNIFYRLKLNHVKKNANLSDRDEEIYSVLIDCDKKEITLKKKTWFFENTFVQDFNYNAEPKKILPQNKVDYTVASTACRTSNPEK